MYIGRARMDNYEYDLRRLKSRARRAHYNGVDYARSPINARSIY